MVIRPKNGSQEPVIGIKQIAKSRGMRVKLSLLLLSLGIATIFAGCAKPKASREPFEYARTWQLAGDLQGATLSAGLSPTPLKADEPAMLKARIRLTEAKQTFAGRLFYRFAYRHGDPAPNQDDLLIPPAKKPEEGAAPRYDDWFEWAEIIEPRFENGETVFTTPVLISKGKVYVQFQVVPAADPAPQELLDWFVYVDQAE